MKKIIYIILLFFTIQLQSQMMLGSSASSGNVGIAQPPNLLLNPNFVDATVWVLDANWSIGGGTLTGAGATTLARQEQTGFDDAATYEFTIEVSSWTSGQIRVKMADGAYTAYFGDSVGTFTLTVVAGTATNKQFSIDGHFSGYNGDITSVYLKRL